MRSLQLKSLRIQRFDIATRMPFKFGITTMTHLPHLFIYVEVEMDGTVVQGVTADHLPPKWFTKDPQGALADEIEEMLLMIEQAYRFARSIRATSVFDFWWQLYHAQGAWAQENGIAPLLAHFGTSLVERGVIDAYCRWHGKPFHQLLIDNAFQVDWPMIHASLDADSHRLLSRKPLATIKVRHTVGLSDPLRDIDIVPEDHLNDGLPQSLEACIKHYDLNHFKIKVNGKEEDINRLRDIAQLLQEREAVDFAFTLDGNEQFRSPDDLTLFWEQLGSEDGLNEFLGQLLFIEQPFHRDVALSEDVGHFLRSWQGAPPVIIDESDAEITSLPQALRLGYSGTSHKNCKGVLKGIANRLLLRKLNLDQQRAYLMSGEDLTNIGPISNHQDLVVQASLGIDHVERNGHHYFCGLSMFGDEIQKETLQTFPNLYTATDDLIHLKIAAGKVDLQDLLALPFGTVVLK